jgi:hypothetical protein
MFKVKSIMFLLSTLVMLSCSKVGNLYKYPEKTYSKLMIGDYVIKLTDSRCADMENKIKIPTVTGIGFDEEMIFPNLDTSLLETFSNSVKENSIPCRGKDYIFEIEILEGSQLFYAANSSEVEFVHVKLRTHIVDKNSNKLICYVYGKVWGQNKSIDASNKSINNMFNKAIKLAFVESLNQWYGLENVRKQ